MKETDMSRGFFDVYMAHDSVLPDNGGNTHVFKVGNIGNGKVIDVLQQSQERDVSSMIRVAPPFVEKGEVFGDWTASENMRFVGFEAASMTGSTNLILDILDGILPTSIFSIEAWCYVLYKASPPESTMEAVINATTSECVDIEDMQVYTPVPNEWEYDDTLEVWKTPADKPIRMRKNPAFKPKCKQLQTTIAFQSITKLEALVSGMAPVLGAYIPLGMWRYTPSPVYPLRYAYAAIVAKSIGENLWETYCDSNFGAWQTGGNTGAFLEYLSPGCHVEAGGGYGKFQYVGIPSYYDYWMCQASGVNVMVGVIIFGLDTSSRASELAGMVPARLLRRVKQK